ncbi:MAG: Rrf2 family transcriptional regulator [Flavobacteriaceae bacterium]|nr:Rrf2 family transcriptional regulator [Flavobacteriaceae bacterium]
MLSQSGKYAVRAVLYLAVHSDETNKIGFKKLSEDLGAPAAFVAKLLQELSRKGHVNSSKGKNGGFYLTESQKHKNLLEIIIEIEGKDKLNNCVLDASHCNHKHPCALHHIAYPKQKEFLNGLKEKTLLDFASEIKKGTSFL